MCRLRIGRQRPAVFLALAGLLTGDVVAAAPGVPASPLFSLSAGRLGIDRHIDSPACYGLEYRMRPVGRFQVVPAIGFAGAENDASFVYAELKRDFRFSTAVIVTPSFGVGRFDPSFELELGQPLEFRSGLEIAYELRNGYRVGVALFHLSNAGFARENPGSEVLVVSFSLPTG